MRIENIDELIDTNLGKEGKYMWECIGDSDLEHFYRGVIKCMIEEYAEERLREFKRKHRAINKVRWV